MSAPSTPKRTSSKASSNASTSSDSESGKASKTATPKAATPKPSSPKLEAADAKTKETKVDVKVDVDSKAITKAPKDKKSKKSSKKDAAAKTEPEKPKRKPAQDAWAKRLRAPSHNESRTSIDSALSYRQTILKDDGTKVESRLKAGRDKFKALVIETNKFLPTPPTDESKQLASKMGGVTLNKRMRRTHRDPAHLSKHRFRGGPHGINLEPKIAEQMLAKLNNDKRENSFSSSIDSQMSAESWISDSQAFVSGAHICKQHTRRIKSSGAETITAVTRNLGDAEKTLISDFLGLVEADTKKLPARLGRRCMRHHGKSHGQSRELPPDSKSALDHMHDTMFA